MITSSHKHPRVFWCHTFSQSRILSVNCFCIFFALSHLSDSLERVPWYSNRPFIVQQHAICELAGQSSQIVKSPTHLEAKKQMLPYILSQDSWPFTDFWSSHWVPLQFLLLARFKSGCHWWWASESLGSICQASVLRKFQDVSFDLRPIPSGLMTSDWC